MIYDKAIYITKICYGQYLVNYIGSKLDVWSFEKPLYQQKTTIKRKIYEASRPGRYSFYVVSRPGRNSFYEVSQLARNSFYVNFGKMLFRDLNIDDTIFNRKEKFR